MKTRTSLEALFNPSRIAVVGATNSPGKAGEIIFRLKIPLPSFCRFIPGKRRFRGCLPSRIYRPCLTASTWR